MINSVIKVIANLTAENLYNKIGGISIKTDKLGIRGGSVEYMTVNASILTLEEVKILANKLHLFHARLLRHVRTNNDRIKPLKDYDEYDCYKEFKRVCGDFQDLFLTIYYKEIDDDEIKLITKFDYEYF